MIYRESHFYAPDIKAAPVVLDEEESHHLFRVLRLNLNDTVFVTDGKGGLAECLIDRKDRERAVLAPVRAAVYAPEIPEITLAAALIRKSQFELLVDLAGQLPVKRILPFKSDYMSVNPDFLEKTLPRLNEKAVVAMKQSEKTHLTAVEGLVTFDAVLERSAGFDKTYLFEKLGADQDTVKAEDLQNVKTLLVIVGPEGGFSPEEIKKARAKGLPVVGLGKNRLRAEAAGFAAVVKLLTLKGSMV